MSLGCYSEIDKKVCKILEEVGMEPFGNIDILMNFREGNVGIVIARALILRPKFNFRRANKRIRSIYSGRNYCFVLKQLQAL